MVTDARRLGKIEHQQEEWRKEAAGGATKPSTPRLAAVEAAEQALELRVWGWGC
jgi:hypothetical protein